MASNPANEVDTGAVLDSKPPGFSPCPYFINMLIRILQGQGRGPCQPFPSTPRPPPCLELRPPGLMHLLSPGNK